MYPYANEPRLNEYNESIKELFNFNGDATELKHLKEKCFQ